MSTEKLTPQAGQRRDEIIAYLMQVGREESRLSVLFRDLIAKSFGINITDGECMDFLIETGHSTAGDLAKLTGLTTGAITGVIRRLENRGLVTVARDKRDRRKVIVRPVMAKVREGFLLYESFDRKLNHLYSQYTDEELDMIAQYYRQLNKIYLYEIERLSN